MSDKVNCDTFDEEINFLKEMLNNLGSDQKVDVQIPAPKPGISTKDANKMKEIMARLPEIEKLLNELLERMSKAEKSIGDHDKKLKNHDKLIEDILAELAKKANLKDFKDLLDRVNQLERDIENIIQHMNNISKSSGGQTSPVLVDNSDKRLTALEKKIEELRNDLNNSLRDVSKTIDALNSELKGTKKDIDEVKKDLLKLMKKVNDLELKLDALLKLSGTPSVTTTISNSPIDEDKLEELKKALNDLKNDFRDFRNNVLDKFSNVDSQIDKKADKEELERLKNLLNRRIDDLENALNKTKNDLKRALRILNDKISKGVETTAPREEREDAMFAKKPLQGWSCASCEKNLVNIQGMPAEYYNWKKMPKSKDRIPMMGQGFSRMLQSISNEYVGNMSSTPLKTTYGNGFKDLESGNSQRSGSKYRPSSSDKKNLNIDDIETDAASKLLPSIKDANRG